MKYFQFRNGREKLKKQKHKMILKKIMWKSFKYVKFYSCNGIACIVSHKNVHLPVAVTKIFPGCLVYIFFFSEAWNSFFVISKQHLVYIPVSHHLLGLNSFYYFREIAEVYEQFCFTNTVVLIIVNQRWNMDNKNPKEFIITSV